MQKMKKILSSNKLVNDLKVKKPSSISDNKENNKNNKNNIIQVKKRLPEPPSWILTEDFFEEINIPEFRKMPIDQKPLQLPDLGFTENIDRQDEIKVSALAGQVADLSSITNNGLDQLLYNAKEQFCNLYFILSKQTASKGVFDLSFYITEFTRVFKIFIFESTRFQFSKINIILFGYALPAEEQVLLERIIDLEKYIASPEFVQKFSSDIRKMNSPTVCLAHMNVTTKRELEVNECAGNLILINENFPYLIEKAAELLPPAYHKYYELTNYRSLYLKLNSGTGTGITETLESTVFFIAPSALIQHILLPYYRPMGSSWVYQFFPFEDAYQIMLDLNENKAAKIRVFADGDITICIPNESIFIPIKKDKPVSDKANRSKANRRAYLKKKGK